MKHRHIKRTLLFAVGTCIAIVAGGTLLWAASIRLPDFDVATERKVEQSTKIFDRTGKILLYDLHENVRRTIVPFDSISRHVKNATVAIEDAEFYQHGGIKISAIIRAIFVNISSVGFTQGGSTITQQVVKNSLLTTEKTIARKLKEWVLSMKLEKVLTKEEILSLYLNEAPYGGSVYGVEEASRRFFNKTSEELTLAESAYIAALPQAPTYYSPYGEHLEQLEARKNLVLRRMVELGFITEDDRVRAEDEVVTFQPQPEKGILAPHFVFYVKDYLEKKYGSGGIEDRGLKVITTLDYELQEKAEEIILKGALQNKENFNAENAGLVALDPKTGQILTMVGSRDYFDEEIDGNVNITLAERQPGSAFKPFVYATAFKKGYTPDTILFDVPTQFSTACPAGSLSNITPCYSPGNYDAIFRGPLTVRQALAQSVNIPAVEAVYLAGLAASIKTARDMGITTLTDPAHYGLTLVLGGGEVTLLELTSAYSVFANDGSRNPTTPILSIEDPAGRILEEFDAKSFRVIDRNISLQMSDILSDNAARTPAFGERSSLYFPGRQVAAKTGTTNDYRDAWIIGYTPSIAAGAWAGNNDNTPMEKKVAGFIIAPLWHEFMEFALQKFPETGFATPTYSDTEKPVLRGVWQGGEIVVVDTKTGRPADDDTPSSRRAEYVRQDVHSILYWVEKDDPQGPVPSNPGSDPQFSRWETAVRAWAIANGYGDDGDLIPIQTRSVSQNTDDED